MQMARWLGAASVAGGALWLLELLLQGEWGPPGTPAYQTYQTINRFTSIPLLLMAVGLVGVHRLQAAQTGWLGKLGLVVALVGFAVITAGSVAACKVGLLHTWAGSEKHRSLN